MNKVTLMVLKTNWTTVQNTLNEIGEDHEEYGILLDMSIEIENQVMIELGFEDCEEIDEMMKFLTS